MTPSAILAALIFLVGPRRAIAEHDRLVAIAEDVQSASDGNAKDAAALLSVGFLEGGFRQEVISCKIRGDKHIVRDGSITTYQLLNEDSRKGHTIEELCESNLLASEAALEVLHEKKRMCRTDAGMFNAYNTGKCATETYISRRALALYQKLLVRFAKAK